MIPSVLLLLAAVAGAQEAPPPPDPLPPLPEEEDPLSPYRLGFEELVERAIGTASVPVEFDWRATTVQLAASGSDLAELNNFNAMRGGLLVRLPTGSAVVELGASYAASWNSPSSWQLARTPYRQPGHPNRMEIDVTVGVPFAEGVVTAAPKFMPAVQLVFNGYAGFRYLLYPTAFRGLKFGKALGAAFAPALSSAEIDNLDDARLDAMEVDPGRYGLMLGLGNDLYLSNGLFLSPRVMLAVPLLAPATETELLLWADLSLAIGIAF